MNLIELTPGVPFHAPLRREATLLAQAAVQIDRLNLAAGVPPVPPVALPQADPFLNATNLRLYLETEKNVKVNNLAEAGFLRKLLENEKWNKREIFELLLTQFSELRAEKDKPIHISELQFYLHLEALGNAYEEGRRAGIKEVIKEVQKANEVDPIDEDLVDVEVPEALRAIMNLILFPPRTRTALVQAIESIQENHFLTGKSLQLFFSFVESKGVEWLIKRFCQRAAPDLKKWQLELAIAVGISVWNGFVLATKQFDRTPDEKKALFPSYMGRLITAPGDALVRHLRFYGDAIDRFDDSLQENHPSLHAMASSRIVQGAVIIGAVAVAPMAVLASFGATCWGLGVAVVVLPTSKQNADLEEEALIED